MTNRDERSKQDHMVIAGARVTPAQRSPRHPRSICSRSRWVRGEHSDHVLDREMYDALAAVDGSAADPNTQRFHPHPLRDYRRAGVDGSPEARARLERIGYDVAVVIVALCFALLGCANKSERPPPPPPPSSPSPSAIPAACEEYREAVQALARCETFPQATRDAILADLRKAERSWKNLGSLPRAAVDGIEEGCSRDAKKLRDTTICTPASLPPACEDYGTALARLVVCEELAADAREEARRRFDQLEAVRTGATSDEQRALEPTCKAALDMLRQAGGTCGS